MEDESRIQLESDGPKSLRSHDRIVQSRDELADLIAEYKKTGWEIDKQDVNYARLKKIIPSTLTPSPRLLSTDVELFVNITLNSERT